MEFQNEKVEYGKREVREIESNVNEVKKHLIKENEELLCKKIKIKKPETYSKSETLRESLD